MEKSERMMREKSRQIRRLEDKVINTRKTVERDLKTVGKGRDEEWSWPEDIDDWRDILDRLTRLTREELTKQDDPVFTSASEGVNDTVIDKGGKPTMVHEISKSTTTELPASLHTAHDNGHDTNETDSSSYKPSVPLGTVNIARASPKDHMTGWDTAKGGWKKPWEDKKDATSKSKSEILADNSDDEGFTTVSNRKRKRRNIEPISPVNKGKVPEQNLRQVIRAYRTVSGLINQQEVVKARLQG
ncbi:hypothetical protein V865_000082 [Kwoniella europaea PYCC6329]|uniref:Uncharacterized protein n=1 Tax=Kwoniella europaea PYCC6329 TaxID=1423913 RepID=A0AAX4K7X9_9TREE